MAFVCDELPDAAPSVVSEVKAVTAAPVPDAGVLETVYWEKLKMSYVFERGLEGKMSGDYLVPKSAIAGSYFAGGAGINDCCRGEIPWGLYTGAIKMCDDFVYHFSSRCGKQIGRDKLNTDDAKVFEVCTKNQPGPHSKQAAHLGGLIIMQAFYEGKRVWEDPKFWGKK
ncbi:MAG: hypothetical protein Hyperionvirus2_108 [Hyperionvirus sp.]|uniref:Uncharacterized protein n=1 Tax=Hyperionvirus sp. TaxID=2487770 RepID=A0A3G5A653_9VIRU|nr:MAG: hypothetical protein Hyperionvirus2_108 [Hyperionvirus sp.]